MRITALLQKLAVGLGLGCVFVAASLTAFVLHLDLPRGRRMVSELVAGALVSELRGSFAIGGVERLRPGVAVVRDFEVRDEKGRVTLRVSRVTLRAAWLGMARELVLSPARARLVLAAVELEYAEAHLYDDQKSGIPSLATAFSPKPRPSAGPSTAKSALRVEVGSLSLSHGYVRGSVSTLPTLELELSQLRGAAAFSESLTELELGRFGMVLRGMGGADARGVGALRLHAPGWVWASFDGFFGDVQVGSVLRVDGDAVFATLDLPRAPPAAMRGMLPAYPIQKDLIAHLEASGRWSELALSTRFELEGARFVGSGPLRLAPELRLELDVTASALDAQTLAPGLPPSHIDGNAHLLLQGAKDQPSLLLRAVTLPGELDGIAIPAAEIEATLRDSQLTGGALLHEPGLPVRATFQLSPGGVFDLHAESSGVELSRAPRLRGLPGAGLAGLRLDAHIENGRLKASAVGDVRNYRRGDFALGHGSLEARASGQLADLRGLNLEAHLQGDDFSALGQRFPKLDARARGPLGAPRLELSLSDARGGELSLAARVALAAKDTRVNDLSLGYKRDKAELTGALERLSVGDDQVVLEGLELRGLGGELRTSLEWKSSLLSVEASGKALRVGDLSRLLGLPSHYVSGTLDFDAEALLARDIERGKLNLKLYDAALGPLPDVTTAVNLVLEDGRLQGDFSAQVQNVADTSARFDVFIPGSVRERKSLRDTVGEVSLDVSRVNLGLLSQVLAPGRASPVQGTLGLALKATRRVPYALPSISLSGYTNGLKVEPAPVLPGLPAFRDIDAQLGLNVSGESGDADASLRLVDARGTLASATISGNIDLVELVKDPIGLLRRLPDAPLLGKILVDERPLSQFPKGVLPAIGEGRLRLEATLSGSLNKPVLAGRLRLGAFELASAGGHRPLDVCANVAWDHATRRLGSTGEVFLSSATREVCAGPRVALYTVLGAPKSAPDARTTLEGSAVLELERMPVDAIPGLGSAGVTGRLSGKASLSQSGPLPTLLAELTLSNARVHDIAIGDGKLEMRSDERALGLTLSLEKEKGSLQATAVAALDYSGIYPVLRQGEPIGLRVIAHATDAVILSPFVQDVLDDVSGTLDADISARLMPPTAQREVQPSAIQGSLILHGGAFELSGLGLKLQGVEFSALAEPDGAETRISVPLLTGHSTQARRRVVVRDARVWLSGVELSRAEGKLEATELPLALPGIQQTIATTRQSISFEVKHTPKEMRANVQIPYLVVALPQAAPRNLISLDENRSIEIVQPIAQPGKISGGGLPWRLAFELGRNVRLTRPDLDLSLSGRAELLLGEEFDVTGDIDLTPGGRIDVSGKTFVVETGEVHFDTGDPANPRIRVIATFRPPDGSIITADVSGTLSQATLSLSSPTRDLQQIYAALLGGGGGGGGDAKATGAGVGADQLLGPLLANTPLRRVELRTGSERSADQRTYSTYSAAVPLSEQVWFEGSYKTLSSQDAGAQRSAVSGTVDFRFRRNWSLRTEIGTIGTGVDLLWSYRY